MKKFIFTPLLLLTGLISNAQIKFQKAFYKDFSYYTSAKQTADSGFIIAGCFFNGIGTPNPFLLKTNSYGDEVWSLPYGVGNSWLTGNDVVQTKDGGYFMAGSLLLKTDSAGQTLWAKSAAALNGRFVIESANGDLLIAGSNQFTSGTKSQFCLIKLDSAGNQIFGTSFGTNNIAEEINSVQLTNDGGCILTGGAGNYALLIKTDSTGIITWAYTYGPTQGGNKLSFAQQTSDGGYLAIGQQAVNNSKKMFLLKVDPTGNIIWSQLYQDGNSTTGVTFYKTADNHFLLCAQSSDGVLINVDSLGTVIWAKRYSPSSSPGLDFNSINPTVDFGLILSGVYLVGSVPYLYLLKTDSAGNADCFVNNINVVASTYYPVMAVKTYVPVPLVVGNISVTNYCFCDSAVTLCSNVGINEYQLSYSSQIYPNPFSDKINLTITNGDHAEIILYDLTSRILLQQKFTNTVSINAGQLAKGVYIYEVRNKDGSCKKGKVVKD